MTDLIEATLQRLSSKLSGRVSKPGDSRYTGAIGIWAKPVGPMPRAVVHCQSPEDVQSAIHAARQSCLPLSVRGGGHDWAGRSLCEGIVIDLSGMNDVVVSSDGRSARISGGARASDVLAATDPRGLAAVTGSCGAVGMAGLALGGGYGPLIGRFGLALDNVVAAEVVLADGRIITASHENEGELFWALRGGGGNFGVVTALQYRLHELPTIRAGMLLFPFSEARSVLAGSLDILASGSDELTAQFGLVAGPDGSLMVMVAPTWCGAPTQGEAQVAPFLRLGTPLVNTINVMPCGGLLALFSSMIVNGQRVFMETSWLPRLDSSNIDACIQAMASAVSPGCAIITHDFKGAASRVPLEATAFGLRRDHVLVEILASYVDRSDSLEERRHRDWAQATRQALDAMALPGGYPNLLGRGEVDRATRSFGCNAERLIAAKRRYDPDNVFNSAIPLPARV